MTRGARASRYFYLGMALLVVAVVVYGFAPRVGRRLIHPVKSPPAILYVHAIVFTGWLAVFVTQSALVVTRHTHWHKRIGWYAVAFGTCIPVLGVATAITMGRLALEKRPAAGVESALIIPLFDMVCFTVTFGLAVWWRKSREAHRRLMLIATCTLTAAAWGRFPPTIVPPYLFYAGVDLLILLGVVRDLVVDRTVHSVYRWALPALVAGHVLVTYAALQGSAAWRTIAHALL